jgi:hypothetical protein
MPDPHDSQPARYSGSCATWPDMTARIQDFVKVTRDVQNLPYSWSGSPEASAAREQRAGTCASKHALLAEELRSIGLASLPLLVVGPLAPAIWPDLVARAAGLPEVHECLTVYTPWAGPLLIDVTWPALAVAAGLPGLQSAWGGHGDGQCAVQPIQAACAVSPDEVRKAKLALRSRLYTPADTERRDAILREITRRVHSLPRLPPICGEHESPQLPESAAVAAEARAADRSREARYGHPLQTNVRAKHHS